MSQHVKVEQGGASGRGLEFRGAAAYKHNIYGNFSPEKHFLFDDFDNPAIDETNNWISNESHGGTATISVAKNGLYRLASSTTDNDKSEVARELCWYASCAAVIEARITVDSIATVAINVGFASAKSYADNLTAFRINGATIEDTAVDAVCFVFDTDANAAYWHYCNTKAGDAAGTSIAIAPVASTYEIFMIALDTLGNATYYRNGKAVGYKALAITTTAALTPYIAVISRAGSAARNLDLDYVRCWQNRG